MNSSKKDWLGSSYTVAICALARDCEHSLLKNIPIIEHLRSHFYKADVVIVENDSKDNTKSILQNWAKEAKDTFIITADNNTITIPEASKANPYPGTSLYRITKMADYRNIYMDWLNKSGQTYDLLIVIDIDVENFEASTIINSIADAPANWGAIFANGFTDTKLLNKRIYTMYHDMYAFSEDLLNKYPSLSYGLLFKKKKNMNSKLRIKRFTKVKSAFGGIGIYKYQCVRFTKYLAIRNNDKYIESLCEHVPFNNAVTAAGLDLYIDKQLEVYYGASDKLIVLRNILPLWMFKTLCIITKFKKLKE